MTQLDADVIKYFEISDQIEQLQIRQNEIKARFRVLDPGKHTAVGGVTITVAPPPRSFNTERAWSMLTSEQQVMCVSPDAKKIKAQLAPTLLDACMDPGKGEPRVVIR